MIKLRSFLFQNKSTGQIIAKNTFWLSFSQLTRKIIRFALIVYAARTLGVEGYGVFAYALGLAGFFAIFSDIGISGLLIRDFSVEGKITPKLLSTFLYIKLFLIGVSVSLVLYVAPLFTNIPEALPLISVIAILMAFDGLKDFIIAVIRSKEKMEQEASVDILTNLATLAFGVLALLTFKSSLSLAVAYTIGSGFGLTLSIFFLRKNLVRIWSYFDKKLAKRILMDAWPFALMGLLGTIMASTDILMLGWLRDAKDVGLYSAAIKPVQTIYTISGILAVVTFPKISAFAKNNVKQVRGLLEKTVGILLLVGLPIIAGGITLSKEIITTIYGVGYLDSTLAFQILLATILAVFPMAIISNLILAYNKQRNFITPLALAAAGNVILNIALIPIYGIVGAAIATVITQFFAMIMIWTKVKKLNYFTILPYTGRILISTALMIAITAILKTMSINFIVNIGISALVYLAFLKILKEPLLKQIRGITNK